MNKYEAMFIVKASLTEEARKVLLAQISDVIAKNGGSVTQANIWSEKRKLYFPLKKNNEGVYYLVNFTLPTDAITKIKGAYAINEDILRVLILVK